MDIPDRANLPNINICINIKQRYFNIKRYNRAKNGQSNHLIRPPPKYVVATLYLAYTGFIRIFDQTASPPADMRAF